MQHLEDQIKNVRHAIDHIDHTKYPNTHIRLRQRLTSLLMKREGDQPEYTDKMRACLDSMSEDANIYFE